MYLVRNSEMGWDERMGDLSPLAMRRMSGSRSSYVTRGASRLYAFTRGSRWWSIDDALESRPTTRRRYSVSELRWRMEWRTSDWTRSAREVTSWMKARADEGESRRDGDGEAG